MGPAVIPKPTNPSNRDTYFPISSLYAYAAKEYAAVLIILDAIPWHILRVIAVVTRSELLSI